MSPKCGNCANYVVIGQKKISQPIQQIWPISTELANATKSVKSSKAANFIPSGIVGSIQIEW